MDISEGKYRHAKQIVEEYEGFQKRLAKVKGTTECPFCGGSKTTPFIRAFKSQDCTDCNKEGQIKNKDLVRMGLDDFVINQTK